MKDAIQRVKEAAERDARDFTATEITDVMGFKISAVEGLEEKSVETSISGVNSPIPNLYLYIQHIDLESEADIQKLNTLDARIRDMIQEEQRLFFGALELERTGGLDDAVHIADNLEQYKIFPKIKTDEDLGHFLVDTAFITGKFRFPEEVQPYLDYAKIGAEQRGTLLGAHTAHGFVKRLEEAPVQAEVPKAMLLTLTASEQSYPLVLPASEKQLEHAKKSLGIEDFAQAVIANAEYTAPYLNQLIPMDGITVEDANEMALCLQEMKQEDGELLKFCAVLKVEQPDTFMGAVSIAMDRDDYELVPEDMDEYGKQVLRRAGADDEVIDTIDGYMDFAQLGRDSMEEDGVRRTEFGLVHRLNKPFPPEPEAGQSML